MLCNNLQRVLLLGRCEKEKVHSHGEVAGQRCGSREALNPQCEGRLVNPFAQICLDHQERMEGDLPVWIHCILRGESQFRAFEHPFSPANLEIGT